LGYQSHQQSETTVLNVLDKSRAEQIRQNRNKLIEISSAILSGITPASSVTCERTLSKMKLIKTFVRNFMADERLRDLSILAIEKDFIIDFEKIVDVFATKQKNSRIIFR
jgi:hypothetical protein